MLPIFLKHFHLLRSEKLRWDLTLRMDHPFEDSAAVCMAWMHSIHAPWFAGPVERAVYGTLCFLGSLWWGRLANKISNDLTSHVSESRSSCRCDCMLLCHPVYREIRFDPDWIQLSSWVQCGGVCGLTTHFKGPSFSKHVQILFGSISTQMYNK